MTLVYGLLFKDPEFFQIQDAEKSRILWIHNTVYKYYTLFHHTKSKNQILILWSAILKLTTLMIARHLVEVKMKNRLVLEPDNIYFETRLEHKYKFLILLLIEWGLNEPFLAVKGI